MVDMVHAWQEYNTRSPIFLQRTWSLMTMCWWRLRMSILDHSTKSYIPHPVGFLPSHLVTLLEISLHSTCLSNPVHQDEQSLLLLHHQKAHLPSLWEHSLISTWGHPDCPLHPVEVTQFPTWLISERVDLNYSRLTNTFNFELSRRDQSRGEQPQLLVCELIKCLHKWLIKYER